MDGTFQTLSPMCCIFLPEMLLKCFSLGLENPAQSLDPTHCPHTPFHHPLEAHGAPRSVFKVLFQALPSLSPKLSHHHLGLIASLCKYNSPPNHWVSPDISITIFSPSSTNCRPLLYIRVWGKRFLHGQSAEFALQVNVY